LAAKTVFATSGVDAPVREIAEKADVGVGTVYRRFPKRADLIAAVFRREIDACADAAPVLAAEHRPGEALARWMQRYAAFVATKRGLATALHSGDPAYDALPAYFEKRLRPALRTLFAAATAAGEMRADVEPDELLGAVARLCMQAREDRAGPSGANGRPARRRIAPWRKSAGDQRVVAEHRSRPAFEIRNIRLSGPRGELARRPRAGL
jgi:AcrR family transcriptional regulator